MFIGLFISTQVSAATFPVEVDFSGGQPSDWELRSTAVWNTAVSSDQTLRLTDAVTGVGGLGFFNDSFSSNLGIVAEFRYYTGGGSGADGFVFFLVDGDQVDENNIAAGAAGGSLGYAQNDLPTDGIPHAYLGVGFDEFGNFITNSGGMDPGSGSPVPDSVVLRGSGDGTVGYNYLTHRDVFTDLGQRIDGGWRIARVTVIPGAGNATVRVEMSWDEGVTWETVIDDYLYNQAPPTNLKLGFSAGTGGSTNIHSIGNLEVIIPVDLQTVLTVPPSGTYERGDAFTYTYTVKNNSTNDSATTTIINTMPVGVLGINNVTWNLTSTHGATSSGTGADIATTTIGIPEGETVTVVVSGTVGASILNTTDLDHTINAVPESTVKDPSPSDAGVSVGVTTDAPTAAESALLTIIAYANSNGTTTTPTENDYTNAGVTGVASTTLSGLNNLLAAGDVSTLGDVQDLADEARIPAVTTKAASIITKTGAWMNGGMIRLGVEDITILGFEYGLTTGYGTGLTKYSNQTGDYSLELRGLTCNTAYHYRAYAGTVSLDNWYGDDVTFTTAGCPSSGSATKATTRSVAVTGLSTGDSEQKLAALRKQIAELQALLATLGGTSTSPVVVTGLPVRDLTGGMSGDDVTALQELLVAKGYAIPAGATGYFAGQTKAALTAYQAASGIEPAQGYFGLITRTQMKGVALTGLCCCSGNCLVFADSRHKHFTKLL